jgi:acetyl esterase/lipase
MHPFDKALVILGAIGVFALSQAGATEPSRTIELWPQGAPGEKGGLGEERDMTKPSDGLVAGKPVIRLGNVSKPIMALFPAPGGRETPAVLVCPGGGYNILAWDLEGTEVCDWLNSIGVTGVLLKYRVPKRDGLEKHTPPLQDAQRAMGLLRARAKEFGIDTRRIGVLGFSAGGHLAATLSNNYQQRTYPRMDEADVASCRPDFTILIYPAYLTLKDEGDKIAPELKITAETPPTFIAMAEDDPVRVENAFFYGLALKKTNVPVELHVYPSGGHGYGLRPSTNLVSTWPGRAEDWLRSREILTRK